MMKGKYFNCSEKYKGFCNKKNLLHCICPFNNSKIESADSFVRYKEVQKPPPRTSQNLIRNTVCDVIKAYYLFGES